MSTEQQVEEGVILTISLNVRVAERQNKSKTLDQLAHHHVHIRGH